jgi:hypothetical protein
MSSWNRSLMDRSVKQSDSPGSYTCQMENLRINIHSLQNKEKKWISLAATNVWGTKILLGDVIKQYYHSSKSL